MVVQRCCVTVVDADVDLGELFARRAHGVRCGKLKFNTASTKKCMVYLGWLNGMASFFVGANGANVGGLLEGAKERRGHCPPLCKAMPKLPCCQNGAPCRGHFSSFVLGCQMSIG